MIDKRRGGVGATEEKRAAAAFDALRRFALALLETRIAAIEGKAGIACPEKYRPKTDLDAEFARLDGRVRSAEQKLKRRPRAA
jgi:hypothetical protein